MKGLREKICKREGFTLVEMLIVVAIIAILIRVSIPLVNSSLEKARHAVDDANQRNAIGLGNIELLTNAEKYKDADVTLYYVVDVNRQGSLKPDEGGAPPDDAVIAQCSSTSCTVDGSSKGKKGDNLIVTIKTDGTVEANWGTTP